jgi:hypothetical protein
MRTPRCLTAPTLLPLLTLVFSTGCGSSATTSTATSPTSINRCAVTATGNGQVPAQGGPGSLAVSAARECAWSASAESQWLTIKAGSTGQGDGAIEFNAAANADPVVRRGAIVLNEQRVEVSQAAGECAYSLPEASGSFPQAGGAGQFEVRASSSLCSWTAQSDAPWVSVRAGASSQGTATVQFDVAAAGGQTRSATITAAGLRFSIVQTSASCTYSVVPGAFTAGAGGEAVTVTVTTGPGCAWSAASTVPWISLSSAGNGTGTGTASFSISPTSAARSGSVIVAGKTIAVDQGAGSAPPPLPCAFSISPESGAVSPAGGAGTVTVTTAAGCPWTAVSNVPWITLTAGGSGNGPGQVSYLAAPGLEARSGTLTIAGRAFTVNQSAGCSYSLAPEVQNVDAGETKFSVGVTSSPGCAWLAASNAPWITLDKIGGIGSDDLKVTVAANPGPARSGTATIAGRTLTINQAVGACAYRVSPLDVKVNDDRQVLRIEVETASTCSWTAVSNVPWIAVTLNASGTGNGDVWISIGENDGKNRHGTVTVAGRTVDIEQRDK